jgi:hypothetical protein
MEEWGTGHARPRARHQPAPLSRRDVFDHHSLRGESMEMHMMNDPIAVPAAADGWFGAMSGQVTAFLAQLRRIPADAWRDCAEADPHVDMSPLVARSGGSSMEVLVESEADRRVRARLRDALEPMPAVVRRIHSRIDTELAVFEGIMTPLAMTRMRRVARLAALALAARAALTADEFERLYRPFRELIPDVDLATR